VDRPDPTDFARAHKPKDPPKRGIRLVKTTKQRWWRDGRTRPEHMFIPDPQVKGGVPIEHLRWAAQYALDQKPDVIVTGQDWWDFPSLNLHERDYADFRTRDLMDDVLSGLHAWDLFMEILRSDKGYNPWIIFQLGNHDSRFYRQFRYDRKNERALPGPKWFIKRTPGVEMSELEEVVCIDGVYYSHYFTNPYTSRALGGTALHKLNKLKFSYTQGHCQGKDIAEQYLAHGGVIRGVVAGSFYQHDEEYKGPQGNNHWRGLIYKHEVGDGCYDLMEVSMDFLRRRYGGKRVMADPNWRADEFAIGEDE
jgi:hypothetical protein